MKKNDNMNIMKKKENWLNLSFLLTLIVSQTSADYGLVYGRSEGNKDWNLHVCISYNPAIAGLPSQQKFAVLGLLKDFSTDYGCYDSKSYDESSVAGDIVGVARGNCTFVEKTDMAEKHKANGVVVVTDHYVLPGVNQTSDIGRFQIPTGTMLKSDYNDLKALGKSVELMMYAPPEEDKFDPCIIVIFFLAVICIAVGGYWSGLSTIDRLKRKEEKEKRKQRKKGYVQSADGEREEDDSDSDKDEDENLDITIPSVIVFFVLVCTFLTLLYFFYDYLVFVIISLFCLAGSIGLFYCVLPLWNYIPLRTRVPRMPCCKHQPEVKDIVLYALCATLAVVWAIERHASYAWVLQDILGLAFCINMLKTIQVPNLKICSILLILLFLYDIFFVFITPYFTQNGESIMVKVATGGSGKSTEKILQYKEIIGNREGNEYIEVDILKLIELPMVFIVPKLNSSPYSVCQAIPSMLGFGDVIVPGLLIGYNHGIDLQVNSKKIYYIATVIAYGIGMIITFIALELMKTGQPALLYLVPCTLLTTFVIAGIRGEVKLLWNGIKKQVSENIEDPKSPPETENNRNVEPVSVDQISIGSSSSIDSENKSLIRK